MWLSKAAQVTRRVFYSVGGLFNIIAISILMVMVFFVAWDVFMRYVFNLPTEGSYEAVALMMAFVFACGIAYTQRHKGHVAVTLLVSRFSERAQAITDSVVYLISLGFLCLLTWRAFMKARDIQLTGEITYGAIGPLGRVPVAPFVYVVASAFAVLSMVFLVDLFTSLVKAVRK